jgi:hypothetical protein
MSAVSTGGAAFPTGTGVTPYNPGMNLRDYFAAKAMQGFAAYIGPSMAFESRAKIAYEWADAMLKARAS